jgi:hypothetical protein
MADYFVGLDLGQASDHTAIAVVNLDAAYLTACRERAARHDRPWVAPARALAEQKLGPLPEVIYEVRYLERMHLRTPYTEVVRHVGVLMETPPLQHNVELVVDATGVGGAVVDILRDAGVYFTSVVITGGEKESRDGGVMRVPKRDLVSTAQVLLQNRRLRISRALPEAKTLTEELMNYRLKQNIATGYVGFEPLRASQHDDLILALCLALWGAVKQRSYQVDESLADSLEDAISEEDLYRWDAPFPWEQHP